MEPFEIVKAQILAGLATAAEITHGPFSILEKTALLKLMVDMDSPCCNPPPNSQNSVINIAELQASQVADYATGDSIDVLGYYVAGDGGGGTFRYDSASAATVNGGTTIAPTVGGGRWLRVWGGEINVLWFGAKNNGITIDTLEIQAAINAAGPLKATVYFPQGNYIHGPLTMLVERVRLRGEGMQASKLQFAPTADDQVAVTINPGGAGSVNYQSGIRGITFYSGDTTYRKIAIDAWDTSELALEDVACYPWTGGTGRGSTGIQLNGREATRIANVSISADQPLHIRANPNSNLSCDHLNLHNTYLLCQKSTNSCVLIDSGTLITNLSTSGTNPWVGGGGALEWVDNTSTVTSLNNSFQNIRYEQPASPSRFAFKVDHVQGVQNLSFINVSAGLGSPGWYLRRCREVTFMNTIHEDNSRVTLDFLNCNNVSFIGCFAQVGSTISIPDMEQVLSFGTPAANTPFGHTSFWYNKPATINNTNGLELYGVSTWARKYTLAAGALAPIAGASDNGRKSQIVRISAYSAVGPIHEAGIFSVVPGSCIKVSGTANIADGDVGGSLCLIIGGFTQLKNNTAQTLIVTVASEWVY